MGTFIVACVDKWIQPCRYGVQEYKPYFCEAALGMEHHCVGEDWVAAGDGRRHEASIGDPCRDHVLEVDLHAW